MPSHPPEVSEIDSLQSLQPPGYADQHTPELNLHGSSFTLIRSHVSEILLQVTATSSRTAPHAPYEVDPWQASTSCDYSHSHNPSRSKDTALLMLQPSSSQSNLYNTARDPPSNLEDSSFQTTYDSINSLYYQPQPYTLYPPANYSGTSYPMTPTQGYYNPANAVLNASLPITGQSSHFLSPREAFPAQRPETWQLGGISLPGTGSYDVPESRQNHQSMDLSQTVQPQIIPHQSFEGYSLPPRGPPTTRTEYDQTNSVRYDLSYESVVIGGRKDDVQMSLAPDVTAGAANWLPHSSLPTLKRGRDDEPSGSAKRLRNNQREPWVNHTTNENGGRGQYNPTEETVPEQHFGIAESSSVRSGAPVSSVRVKDARFEPTNGFFTNSSNIVIQRPLMVDSSQHHHIQGDQPDGTLLWLKTYIMEGAEFDSSERDPPPRCHPDTRASIIKRMIDWIKDPRRERKMRWVRGTAGVGKSAIVQTVFESVPEEIRGGSVFFSRSNGRDNPNEVFPSIAYQLAVRDLPYRAYLKGLMLKDPRSLNKSMKEQFRVLFEVPFVKQKLLDGQDVLVIVLDGLDECGGDPTYDAADPARSRGRSSESVQREIVELISDFIQQHTSVPLIWIIASRPEKHLQVTFAGEKVESTFSEEEVPVDSVEACRDVAKYLNSEFKRIQKNHDDLITTTPWPSSKDFSLITTKASGLFIFAQVVIRFIDDSNPIAQLKCALAAISKASSSEIIKNPLVVLDLMYREIVSKVPSQLLEPAMKIIGAIAVFDGNRVARAKTSLSLICNILNIHKDVSLTALRHLHSVLFFPKVIVSARPRFYHASFRDFLQNESRSHEYSLKAVEINDTLLKGLMRFYGSESFDDNLLPWPGNGDLLRLVNTANDAQPMGLYYFYVFSKLFYISKAALLQLLPTHDFARSRTCPWFDEEITKGMEGRLQSLEQIGAVYHKPLDSFEINCDTVSICKLSRLPEKFPLYVLSLNELRSSGEDEEVKALRKVLRRWIDAEPERLMRVWGQKQFKRSVGFKLSFKYDPANVESFDGLPYSRIQGSLFLKARLLLIGF